MAKMIVKRLGVLSFAKIQAVIMAFFGVIIGVIYGLVFMIFGAAMMAQGGGAGAGAGPAAARRPAPATPAGHARRWAPGRWRCRSRRPATPDSARRRHREDGHRSPLA